MTTLLVTLGVPSHPIRLSPSNAMRPLRFKLRTLIVLVAVATLGVGGVEYWRRAAEYRALAHREAALEAAARSYLARDQAELSRRLQALARIRPDDRTKKILADPSVVIRSPLPSNPRELVPISDLDEIGIANAVECRDLNAMLAEWYARRRAAYLRCARYPWLSPPGDEPEPEPGPGG